MRKPRDFDAELKALTDKAKGLKDRKIAQLGELVIACHADALSSETLAGALLVAVETKDTVIKEAWRKRGVTFFLRPTTGTRGSAGDDAAGAQANDSGKAPR
jgi:DNA-binding protein H-NS